MVSMHFSGLLGRGRLHRIPLVGPALHLLIKQGLYNSARTIFIPTDEVPSTRFSLSDNDIVYLDQSGRDAAEAFLAGWDFDCYKQQYRTTAADMKQDE
ncbi:hypothetical protein [Paenibacillus kobensis]|uniref:hypothetical protein n=1 Tax=Paenibacillus kobensis TaxID=59841 RepID=UPI000FD889A9|nr:hypothetical protein [Paenibacillus kobensis]